LENLKSILRHSLSLIKIREINKENLNQKIIRGALGAGAIKISSLGFSLILSVVLARTLGPSEFGLYSFIFAIVSILVIPAQMGLPNLVVRETACSLQEKNFARIRGIWRWSTIVALISCTTIAILGVGLAIIFTNVIPTFNTPVFYWGLVLMPLIALGTIRGAALRGLGVVAIGLLPEFIILPCAFVSLITFSIFILNESLDASKAMSLHVIAATISFFAGGWLLHRFRPLDIKTERRIEYLSQNWKRSTLSLALIAGAGMITRYTDIIMLGIIKHETEVGIYRIAAQWTNFINFGLIIINFVTPPYFARLYTARDTKGLQNLSSRTARVSLALALPPFILFTVLGKYLISMLVGSGYELSYYPMLILATGQLINSATGSVAMILSMTGHEKESAKIMVISVVLNVILNISLIPIFGASGAAAATTITLSAQVICLCTVLYKKTGIISLPIWQNLR
jgi:O-antigen/teichoic acid export membrane protein